MSHPYHSDDYSQHYYSPDSYDAPVQSHAPAYDNSNYYYQAVTPSAHAVDNSPVQTHPQSHTYYSDVNYTSDTTTNHYSSYAPAQHMVPHYPDSANQVPHQAAPAQTWAEPGRYTEATTVQSNDFYEQRRSSCTSSTDGNNWYPQNQASTGHYGHQQPVYAQQSYYTSYYNHAFQYRHQPDSMSFGMYSPTQYLRTQELARHAPLEPVSQPEPTPYGTLPIHETRARSERRSSDAYQTLDNDSTGHTHTTQFSPFIQSHPPPTESSAPSSPQEGSDSSEPPAPRDLYVQQRFAADYQHVLQAQQELKYQQLSGQLEQLEANVMNNQPHAHHHHHRHHHHPSHHRQDSSSRTRLPHTPVVPSQARERPPARARAGSKGEEKKAPSKKPALACLFCRKRKIACGPPSPDNPDRTCNQCARRKQTCEYPTESRRGIRKSQKERAREEPTVHKFVTGQASSSKQKAASKGGVGPIRRVRRKRS